MGQTLIDTDEEGNHYAAKVVCKIVEKDSNNEKTIKFIVDIAESEYDHILSYSEISHFIEELPA